MNENILNIQKKTPNRLNIVKFYRTRENKYENHLNNNKSNRNKQNNMKTFSKPSKDMKLHARTTKQLYDRIWTYTTGATQNDTIIHPQISKKHERVHHQTNKSLK